MVNTTNLSLSVVLCDELADHLSLRYDLIILYVSKQLKLNFLH